MYIYVFTYMYVLNNNYVTFVSCRHIQEERRSVVISSNTGGHTPSFCNAEYKYVQYESKKVSVSNGSYSVLQFMLLYCVLLRGRSNGPHKEDKRKACYEVQR